MLVFELFDSVLFLEQTLQLELRLLPLRLSRLSFEGDFGRGGLVDDFILPRLLCRDKDFGESVELLLESFRGCSFDAFLGISLDAGDGELSRDDLRTGIFERLPLDADFFNDVFLVLCGLSTELSLDEDTELALEDL